MITELFGKPNMPTILDDCLLIEDDNIVKPIGKVYFFTTTRNRPVREFGGDWPTDIIDINKNHVGYFERRANSSFGFLEETGRKKYSIQSSSNNKVIYKLNDVIFTKVTSSFTQNGAMEYVKFSCLSYTIIFEKDKG